MTKLSLALGLLDLGQANVMLDLKQLQEAVIHGDAQAARTLCAQALAEGADPLKLVNEHLVPAMDDVGRRFQCN
jgi:5-methyltetrahydrofolate--homocysteine methyltransferase